MRQLWKIQPEREHPFLSTPAFGITMVEDRGTGGVEGRQTQRNGVQDVQGSPVWQRSVYINENFSVTSGTFFGNYFRRQLSMASTHAAIMETAFDPFKAFGEMHLSASGQKMKCLPNAGGSSVASEVLSYEMLRNCFGAELDRTEMELTYFPEGGSMVDYTCRLYQRTVGVSVTRAMKYGGDYQASDAERLLVKKLEGAVQATRNSLVHWNKRLLHVWATSERVAALVQHAFLDLIPSQLRANTMVLVTVATGAKAHDIFYENCRKH